MSEAQTKFTQIRLAFAKLCRGKITLDEYSAVCRSVGSAEPLVSTPHGTLMQILSDGRSHMIGDLSVQVYGRDRARCHVRRLIAGERKRGTGIRRLDHGGFEAYQLDHESGG